MVVDHHVGVGAQLVQLQVQAEGGGDVPVAVEDLAVAVEGEDVAGAQLVPGQLPGVGEYRAVALAHGDVPGDVVVPALATEHPAHQRDLRLGAQLGQQRTRAGVGGELLEQLGVDAFGSQHGDAPVLV
ncbi:hypothetical protein D3C75_1095120 [compost metagenome]